MMQFDVIKIRDMMRTIAAASAVVLATGAGSAFAHIDVSGHNGVTGANSVNENLYEFDDEVEVDIENDSEVDNVVVADVSTGGNDISMNTTVEDVETGTVMGVVEFDTVLNAGEEDLDVGALMMQHSAGDFSNHTTGANSENRNDLEVDREVEIDIENSADVTNTLSATATTGQNAVRENTTVGDVTTGDVVIRGEFDTTVNASSQVDLSGVGETHADADFENNTTGFQSSNINEIDVDSELEVDVENSATVTNTAAVNASTGENAVNQNTTVGDITTGDVHFTVRSNTTAN